MGIASIVTPRGLTATGAANAQELKMIEHATTKAVTDTGASRISADDIPTFANDDFDADSSAVFSVHQYARLAPGYDVLAA